MKNVRLWAPVRFRQLPFILHLSGTRNIYARECIPGSSRVDPYFYWPPYSLEPNVKRGLSQLGTIKRLGLFVQPRYQFVEGIGRSWSEHGLAQLIFRDVAHTTDLRRRGGEHTMASVLLYVHRSQWCNIFCGISLFYYQYHTFSRSNPLGGW